MATQVSETSGKSRARGSGDELAVIAQRAQAFTNASGTAIALSEGSADELICRARSGASAPDVGTAMRVEGSFTGLCVQSGKELRCDDAETDTRVDTVAIRALGIRSMVVTPIKEDNRVVGVLAVFAPTPHAFTITHVAVLKTMSDQISILLQKERRAREEGREPEPARAAPPVNMPKPVAAAPVVPPAVVIKPAAPAPRASFPVVSRVEPIKAAAAVTEDVAPPVPLPRKEEKRAEQKYEHRAAPSFEPVAGEEKPSGNRNMIAAVVVGVVVIGGGTFGYLKMRKPSQPQQHTQETAALPASIQPNAAAPGATANQPSATTPGNPAGGASAPAPAASAAAKPAPDTSAADAARRAAAERAAERAAAERTAARNNNNNNNTPPPQPEKHAPAAVELSSGASKIAGGQGNTQPPTDVAPVLMVNNTNVPSTLTSLAKPVAASTPAVVSHSDLEPAQVTKRVAPVYPAIAKARRLSGNVTVQALVGADGKITNLQLVSGPPVFKESAFDAMKQCQFKPARLNGQAIEQAIQIQFNYKPN